MGDLDIQRGGCVLTSTVCLIDVDAIAKTGKRAIATITANAQYTVAVLITPLLFQPIGIKLCPRLSCCAVQIKIEGLSADAVTAHGGRSSVRQLPCV